MSSSSSLHLDARRLTAIRRAWRELVPARRGLPIEELVRLGRAAIAGKSLTIDVASARRLGCPVVVLAPAGRDPALFAELTPRERDVARLVANGLRNVDIAAELQISIATVKDHVHHILEKTSFASRTELAAAMAREDI